MSKYIRESKTRKIIMQFYNAHLWQLPILVGLSGLVILGLYSRSVMIIAAVLLTVYMLWIPVERCLEIMLFFLSFENVFKLSYSSSSLLTYLLLVPILKTLIINGNFQLCRQSIIAIALLSAYIILFLFNGIIPLLKIIIGFLLLICVFQTDIIERINCKNLVFYYSFGIIASSIYSLLFSSLVASYVSSLVVRFEDGSAINRFTGLYQNPNYFSIEISLALASHQVLYMNKEENSKEFVLIGIPLLILGIMSQSKAFVVTLIVMLLSLYLFYFKSKNSIAFIISGTLFILWLFFRTQTESIINRYFYRLISLEETGADLSEITTGRIDIWNTYFEQIMNNPRILILGNGIETAIPNVGAHNMFIELLYCMGVIGTLIYMISLISIQRSTVVNRKYFLFLIVLILRGFSANIAFYNNLYYYYLILFALRSTHKCNNEGDKQYVEDKKECGRYIRV